MKALKDCAAASLAGVFDTLPYAATSAAREFGCSTYSSSDELLESSDAVVIATPNDAHQSYAASALDRELRVLCEKPLGSTVQEAEAMLHAAQCAATVACVGFNYRFLSPFQNVQHLLGEGRLGELHALSLSWRRSSALEIRDRGWRATERNRATGGALGDLGVHLLDLVEFLSGMTIRSEGMSVATATRAPGVYGAAPHPEDWAFVSGALGERASFALEVSKSTPSESAGMDLHLLAAEGEVRVGLSRDATRESVRVGDRTTEKLSGVNEPESNEVPGWTSSVHLQIEEWIGPERGLTIAGFSDGLRTQRQLEHMLRIASPS